MATNQISQIKVGSTTYDINALLIGGQDIQSFKDSIISGASFAHFKIITDFPEGSGIDKNVIYLRASNNGRGDNYDEYIYINNNWEKIGNTDIDLSGYVPKSAIYTIPGGTYSTDAATATGTTSETDEVTVTTGSVNYLKAASTTASGYDYSIVQTGAAKSTVTSTFKGKITSVTPTFSQASHGHNITQATTTINTISKIESEAVSDHTHNISSHGHSNATVVKSVDYDTTAIAIGASVTGNTGAHTHTVTGTSSNLTVAQVAGEVLEILSPSALTSVSNAQLSGSHTHSIDSNSVDVVTSVSYATTTVASTSSATTITTTSAGGHSHTITPTTASHTVLTGVTLGGGLANITMDKVDILPIGSVTTEVEEHTHEYKAPKAHTHTIGSVNASTDEISITLPKHSHTVSVAEHSHKTTNDKRTLFLNNPIK